MEPQRERHSFRTSMECQYVVQTPPERDSSFTVFALHGYGMDADTMLRLTTMWFPRNAIVSLQAPHPFYRDVAKREVGYSWATHAHSEESVRVHHEVLRRVMEASAVPPERRLLLGFSQSVGLNYRFAATEPAEVRGVIGVCGGMPGNWETGNYRPVRASLLHIARTNDEVYPIGNARNFGERLSTRAADVEFLELPGAHRFPSLAGPSVLAWAARRWPQ